MSTIKVDKLQGTSGSATALTLNGAASTFNGVHTVGNNAIYTSDGGAVTQNLVSSVAKLTVNATQAGAVNSASSLNVSSVADGAAGINTINATTAFSAILSAIPNSSIHDSGPNRGISVDNSSSSSFQTTCFVTSTGAANDSDTDTAVTIHGDLA